MARSTEHGEVPGRHRRCLLGGVAAAVPPAGGLGDGGKRLPEYAPPDGRGEVGLAAALGAYMDATPACEQGKHVRAAVVKELARWNKAEAGGASSSTATAEAAAADGSEASGGSAPAGKGKAKRKRAE